MFEEAWTIARKGIVAFVNDNALSRGGAIAFYAVTSFVPALIVAVALLSAVFGEPLIHRVLARALAILLGREGRALAMIAINSASSRARGLDAELIGAGVLVVTGSGAFSEIQAALNAIWNVGESKLTLAHFLRARLTSLLLVMGVGAVLLLSILATAILAAWAPGVHLESAAGETTLGIANFLLSFLLASVLFTAIYKVLPDIDLQWSDVVVGGIVTALLYELGQVLISAYLRSRTSFAGYGATGGTIVMLLWIYYSTQVFLLGAELTKAYAMHHGMAQRHPRVQPAE